MTYENILYRLDQGIDNYGTGLSAPVDPSFLYETEEERRKRLEKERQQTVSTQTVETAADGTQTVTTKEVAQPVTPDTFNRMVQVESGGQNFTPQGQPLTSPKGAMFATQVMPATAAQPGFGVRPAQAQTPEEYNRVGQEYYQALLKKYNGNEQLAAAAYNMGPGAVDKNIQRNQGQFNVQQAPQETQGYLNKVFQGAGQAITNMFPSAQAGTLPQPEAGAGRGTMGMPQAFPEEGVAVATGRGVQGTTETPAQRQMAIVTGQNVATTSSQPYIDIYQRDQNDPLQLLALHGDSSAPEFIRKRAGERAYELMDQEYKKAQAEKQAKELVLAAGQGDRKASNTIARELQSEQGSWLKFLFLGFINKELAGMELVKLGFGNVDKAVQDSTGNSYMVTYNALGSPVKGFSADGKELSQEQLIKVAAGQTASKGVEQGAQVYIDPTGTVKGTFVLERRPGQTPIYKEVGTGRPATAEESARLRQSGVGGTLADQYQRRELELFQKLQYRGPEKVAEIVAEDEALYGPMPPAMKQATLDRARTAAPNMGTPTGVPRSGAAVSGPAGGVPGGGAPAGAATTGAAVSGPAVPGAPAGGAPVTGPAVPGEEPTTIAGRRAGAKATEARAIEGAKVVGKQEGTNEAQDMKNQKYADDTYKLIQPIAKAIKESTGSGIGAGVDTVAGLIGSSPKGAQAISRLDVLSYQIMANVPRFEGPQSDYDVQLYRQAAGDLANPKKPVETRLAALDAIIQMLQRYDKKGRNDWTYGGTNPAEMPAPAAQQPTQQGTTASGNKFKRVQ